MEAKTLLGKIRERGFTIKLAGMDIFLSPKRLINNTVIEFIREHKQKLLTALYQEQDAYRELHRIRKRNLRQGRLDVFRILLRRFMADALNREIANNKHKIISNVDVEEYLDFELIHYHYDLEKAITEYRGFTLEPVLSCQCGYQQPFCSCSEIFIPCEITCDSCKHFTPDNIGDGTGIGSCGLGIESTLEIHGRMPLFRYASRRCDKFHEIKI